MVYLDEYSLDMGSGVPEEEYPKYPILKRDARKVKLEGFRFGKLLVVEFEGVTEKSFTVYRCLCDCGKKHYALGHNLTQGTVTSCGCSRKNLERDLRGRVFGRLTAQNFLRVTKGKTANIRAWVCSCTCGKTDVVVLEQNMLRGRTKSCGCLNLERIHSADFIARTKEIFDKAREGQRHDSSKVIGRRFGRLVVETYLNTGIGLNKHKHYYHCQCDCGNKTHKPVEYGCLTSGQTSSCGCLKVEVGRKRFTEKFLKNRVDMGLPTVGLGDREYRLTPSDRKVVYAADDFKCALCNRAITRKLFPQIHHIVPFQLAPELIIHPNNLITLCRECHIQRVHQSQPRGPVDTSLTELLVKKVEGRNNTNIAKHFQEVMRIREEIVNNAVVGPEN